MKEIWKVVTENPKYQVSNLGRVKGPRTILKQTVGDDGYHRICYRKGNKTISPYVHRLVAMHFVDGDHSLEVNHKNGNKSDNRKENLEWVTRLDNQRHAWETGLVDTKHENHPQATITIDIARKIKEMIKSRLTQREISEILNASKDVVKNISRNKTWKE